MAIWKSEYFYGNKISDYGLQEGYVDYATLSKCFQHVMCSDDLFYLGFECEQVCGVIDYTEEIEDLQWEIDDLEDEKAEIEDALIELSKEARRTTREDIWAHIQGEEEEYPAEFNRIEDKIHELSLCIENLQDEMNYTPEIMQYYIVSKNALDILALNNEIVYYIKELDLYIWGVTHWGTSWDYVLTGIKIELEEGD